jgi:hypothetical protein
VPRTPKDGGKPPKDAGKKDTEKRPATGVVLPLNRERDHKGRLRNPHPDQLCGANLTSGNGTCKNRAGQFTEHPGFGRCGYHGGNTKPHRTKAARDEANEAEGRLVQSVHRTADAPGPGQQDGTGRRSGGAAGVAS